ncbi:bifunctional methylenetetrahydrofolate dehydrogenase/methenyltetrahydrofolate cyclohydrolase FolD [Fictibacillus nanhaiensis]|uniref:bifunctional methylenetetrahydrofolate dehydrogenase/methenyltetrahydrofolate cyclohydrolase FolD n=1 Tax=Fictibacillus nanhaiensis TaxID=742169 RepID=UPI001C969DB1|nr:bifunctional methylenetetrahydrofolate dehydrogenase/methenyltetrahydrofolate cyclohydrolase FolD [Fictibacillus nanhaiensis]MBY6035553.1 bifunctional methylenetetrahydrofolate dehydrogenase/methenyltetrahydrofolate cyclohydrolase FolD [Fictibacillus nanhaiensis]
MTVLDGKQIAKEIREQLAREIQVLKREGNVPGLAVILVGDHPASRSYVLAKERTCKELGMHSVLTELPESISEKDLLDCIQSFNNDEQIDGILVQLPLPSHISESKVIETILPEKDVDGFHPINIGRMHAGDEHAFIPCTPLGILEMVKRTGVEISGKHVVVVGRSNLVGKPAGQLFLQENATVTFCHSKTRNLAEQTLQADILIAAVGKQNVITEEMVREGAVVIDVGVNRMENGKLCGDVDFESIKTKAKHITPVPGGVGPMTITMLMNNTVLAAKWRKKTKEVH